MNFCLQRHSELWANILLAHVQNEHVYRPGCVSGAWQGPCRQTQFLGKLTPGVPLRPHEMPAPIVAAVRRRCLVIVMQRVPCRSPATVRSSPRTLAAWRVDRRVAGVCRAACQPGGRCRPLPDSITLQRSWRWTASFGIQLQVHCSCRLAPDSEGACRAELRHCRGAFPDYQKRAALRIASLAYVSSF